MDAMAIRIMTFFDQMGMMGDPDAITAHIKVMMRQKELVEELAQMFLQNLDNVVMLENWARLLAVMYRDEDLFKDYIRFGQVIAEIGLNKIVDHLLANDHPSENSYIYFFLNLLLNLVMKNTADTSYVCSRREEIFTRLLYGVKNQPLPPRGGTDRTDISRYALYMQAFTTITGCLFLASPPTLPNELIEKYGILDHIAKAARLDEDNKKDQNQLMTEAAGLTYTLAALGDDICRQRIKSHECFKPLCSYVYTVQLVLPGDHERNKEHHHRMVKRLQDAVAGHETDLTSLEPYQRMASVSQSRYFVFCSSPACYKVVNKDGILRRCAKCKLTHYCDKECQTQHWLAGHKKQCIGKKASSK